MILVGLGVVVLQFSVILVVLSNYRKVEPGLALVRTGRGGTKVATNGIVAFPVIHQTTRMDIRLKHIPVSLKGREAPQTKDGLLVDIEMHFYVRPNPESRDILQVFEKFNAERTFETGYLRELFQARFETAIREVVKRLEYVEMLANRERLREEIINEIGVRLDGFQVDDGAISQIGNVPLPAPKAA